MQETARQTSLYGFEFREVDDRRTERTQTYDIKQLWQRSHEIVGLALGGMKQVEIAKILNISPVTVSNTLNSTLGKKKLAKMRGERDEEYIGINEKVKELTIRALDVYEELLQPANDPKMKKETADTVVLEVAGMRAPTRIESKGLYTSATLKEIEDFKKRGIEAAREAGLLIDIKQKPKSDN